MTRVPRPAEGIRAGTEAAERSITGQADAGMDADAIARHQDDAAARVLSNAVTGQDRGFARGYSVTASALVADLRDLDRPEPARLSPRPPSRPIGHVIRREGEREAG